MYLSVIVLSDMIVLILYTFARFKNKDFVYIHVLNVQLKWMKSF